MALYAIGDLQGCLNPFEALLERIGFRKGRDRLWLAGDLVNRGPDSLGVLRSVYALRGEVQVVLGNHDLYCLARAAGVLEAKDGDTLAPLLAAPDGPELFDWLRRQPFLHVDGFTGWCMVHAGLHPDWDLELGRQHAESLSAPLRGPGWREFLAMLWSGPAPARWEDCGSEEERQRFRAGVFTRTRLVTADGCFLWSAKPPQESSSYQPWHALYLERHPGVRVVCGHWAAQGLVRQERLLALDSGCVWGKQLSAARLDSGAVLPPVWQQACPQAAAMKDEG